MKTTTPTQYCNTLVAGSGSCADVPCELPVACRPAYYDGKLLTSHDFNLEQRYHIDKHRLHNLAMHGWGIVYGLKVKPHPYCPDQRLVIEPGLAIDRCGREIRLIDPVEILLPQAPRPTKPKDPCPPEGEPTPVPPEHCKLWLSIRYCEEESEFAPAPFDECNCGVVPNKPNRVCECYCIEFHAEEPECFKEHHPHDDCNDCRDIFAQAMEEIPTPKPCCIPLSIIDRFTPGAKVEQEMIDDCRHRATVPSVHTLDRLVRCILDKMPRHKLTCIEDINWTHGEHMDCRRFHERFIKSPSSDSDGFVITFDGPVHDRGVNERTFQAMIVFHSGSRIHQIQMAPATVDFKDHHRCHLHIDPAYANELHMLDFDLFISLKCDVVLDESGYAVDGNLMARKGDDGYYVDAPTGDGVPGGLFQSWIRIRHNKTGD